MTRVGGRFLFGIFLVFGAIATITLAWMKSKGSNPLRAPLVLTIALVLVAAVVIYLGWRVRKWVRTGEEFDPIGATRTLAFAQAAALVGAMQAGYFVAQIVVSISGLPAPEPAAVVSRAVVALGASALLIGAGLFAQWCCQVPPSDDDNHPSHTPKHP